MSTPTQKSEQVMHANMVYAIGLLNEGTSPEVVQAKLVERGLSEDDAAGVVYNLVMQSIYTDAVDMLNRGLSPQQVKQQLAAKGLEQQTASAVVEDILAQNPRPPQAQGSAGGALLKLLGGAVFVAGIGLLFGNVTGAFPTFPYAGFITMGIGSLIWGAAEAC